MRFCLFTILVELQSCVYTETVPVCLSVYFRPLFLLPVCLNATVSFRVLLPLCLHVCLLISFRLYLSSSPPLPDYISICFCLFCPIFSPCLCACLFASISLHILLPLHLSVCLCASVSFHPILSLCPSVGLFAPVFIRLLLPYACLSICYCLSPSCSSSFFCLPVYLPLSVSLFVTLFACVYHPRMQLRLRPLSLWSATQAWRANLRPI